MASARTPGLNRARLRLLALSLWLAAGACTCEPDKTEEQRKVLSTKERAKARAEMIDARRFKQQDGSLRPSDIEVAGLVLPRGIAPHRKFEHEWYYRTLRADVTLDRLEEYFRAQLITLKLERHKTGAIKFINAQLKADPGAPLVTVRISPLLNGVHRHEVYIRQTPPKKIESFPTGDEAAAQLKARRKYAD